MGVLTRMFAPTSVRGVEPITYQRLADIASGGPTKTGVHVSPANAMTYTAVLACVRVLAESIASLPCIVYERVGEEERKRATGLPLYRLLHNSPNPRMTAFGFFEQAMAHLTLWGNFYCEIEWSNAGRPLALWPLRPDVMQVAVGGDGRRQYTYGSEELAAGKVLHLMGLSVDGVTGASLIRLAREAVGLGLATQEFGATVFKNGAVPGIVLRHPGELGPEGHTNLRREWNEMHSGLENSHKVAILEEGMSIDKLGIPPEDAQFLETRRFQVEEIARIFRVPLHKLADLTHATFSNIEHQGIEFTQDTVRPWAVRIEQEIAKQLMTPDEQDRYYAEFLLTALLRGDTPSRYQAYATGRQWGWLSSNDIRRLENMDPVTGGDVYLQPLNMVVAGKTTADGGQRTAGGGRRALTVAVRKDDLGNTGKGRKRLAEVARPQLEEAAQRVLNREQNDIGKMAKKLPQADLSEWLDRFLNDHQAFVESNIAAPVTALGQLAGDAAEEEVGSDTAADALELFLAEYVTSRSGAWIARLRLRLRKVMEEAEAAEAGTGPAAVIEALQKRKDDEAADWSRDQATRIVNAAAVIVWTAVGVTVLRWIAFGDNCDYCGSLNGKTVGVSEWFVKSGEEMKGGDGKSFSTASNVRHPPLHDGCDCMIVPG